MATVGERLKVERETRKMTLDEMVVATGIGQSYLDALERGAIDELPGKAFGKLYIRAYAEVFGFDPQPWIDDYDREQRLVQGPSTEAMRMAPVGSRPVAEAIARWKAVRAAAEKVEPVAEPVAEPVIETLVAESAPEVLIEQETPFEEPAAPPEVLPTVAADVVILDTHARIPTVRRAGVPLLLLGVVAIASAIYFGIRGTGSDQRTAPASSTPTKPTPPRVEPPSESRPIEPPPPVVAKPQASPPASAPVVRTAGPAGDLTVSEFGVGLRIVNLRLEGESDHFSQGSRVCFASRVLGGRRGDRIRHVWLHEGRIEQTIPLRLGGPDFRTHSNKTLGHAGNWAIEARDDRGAVLARATFTCLPPDR
jgi:transcriptional regulator with XRE-family HTH domain